MNAGNRIQVGVAVALIAVGAVGLWSVQRDRDRFAGRLASSQARQDELATAVATLSGQVQALGGEPAVEVEQGTEGPEVVPGPPGERGPAPSDAQVETAVARYCGINDCAGPSGPAPSSLQVAAAVAAYCDDRGECRGADGAVGSPGEAVVGPQGPGPTGEQIAAAVESFCAARDGCQGPAGADGEDSTVAGPQGEPGPACPEGAEPIAWTVDQSRSLVVGLEPGTYLVCRAAA